MRIFPLCLAVLVADCAAPPLTLYTLADATAVAPAAPLAAHPLVIEIARVRIPDDLDSEDIVVLDGNILRRSTTGRWANRLSLEITALLTRELAARRPDALVTDVRQLTSPADRLLVSITRLDITAGGTAQITADWQIVPDNAAAAPARNRMQFSLEGPITTDREVVALEAVLVRKLSDSVSLPGSE